MYVYIYIYDIESERERERKQTIPVRVSFLVYPLDYDSVSFSITRKPLKVEIEVIQRSE